MELIYFIIILILFLVFFKFEEIYKTYLHKNNVNDKLTLTESKFKKTFEDIVSIDELYRIITDIAIFSA